MIYIKWPLVDGSLKRDHIKRLITLSGDYTKRLSLYFIFQVGGLVFVAGQIGLVPGSMTLASGIENQARLGLRHLARVLDVFNCSTRDIVQVGCFNFTPKISQVAIIREPVLASWQEVRGHSKNTWHFFDWF
jgi:hypothetical protein